MKIIPEIKEIVCLHDAMRWFAEQIDSPLLNIDTLNFRFAEFVRGCEEYKGYLYQGSKELSGYGTVGDLCYLDQGCLSGGTLYFKTNIPGVFVSIPFYGPLLMGTKPSLSVRVIPQIKEIATLSTSIRELLNQAEIIKDLPHKVFFEKAYLLKDCSEQSDSRGKYCQLFKGDEQLSDGSVADKYYYSMIRDTGYSINGLMYFKTDMPGQFIVVPYES